LKHATPLVCVYSDMLRIFIVMAVLSMRSHAVAAAEFQIVAVGDSGRRIASRDGMAWSHDTRWAINEGDLHDIVFACAQFVAVGGNDTRGRILASRDGTTWREIAETKQRITTIAAGGDRFVAAQGGELLFSKDGERFEHGAKLPWTGTIRAQHACFGGGEGGPRFLFIGDQVNESGELHHWRASTEEGEMIASAQLDSAAANGMAYGAGHFVLIGRNGLIETSHDGAQWTRRPISHGDDDLTSIVWDGQRFIVTSPRRIFISKDAMTWSEETHSLPCTLASVERSFGAFGFTLQRALLFSKDLNTWNSVVIPPGPALRALAVRTPRLP